MSCRVRPYQPGDREAVRRICADTGFMGNPIDVVFSDREVLADFFTRYYTDCEPENAFVAEDGQSGEVVGYLLGALRYRYHRLMQVYILATRVAPKIAFRLLTGRYNRASRRYLYWVVFKAARETPPAPDRSAHFHINLLPSYRNGPNGRALVFTFFKHADARGMKRIYGQIQTQDDRRTSFFTRYGFREIGRRRITKFERYHDKPVYVSTLFRDLEEI